MGPAIPLLPQPILTRWDTWVEAAVYYCDHFNFIETVIYALEENDKKSTKFNGRQRN